MIIDQINQPIPKVRTTNTQSRAIAPSRCWKEAYLKLGVLGAENAFGLRG